MPGVDPVPGWLHVSKTDNDDEIRDRCRAAALDRRQCRSLADRARARGAAEPALFRRAAFSRRVPHSSAQLRARAWPPTRKKPARAFSRTRRRSRSIRPACASASTRRARACARAHVVLAGNVQLGELMPRLAATLLPITTFVLVTEPIGRCCTKWCAIAARSATPTAPTIITASSAATGLQWSGPHAGLAGRSALGPRAGSSPTSGAIFPLSARSRSRICGAARSAAPSTACRRSARSRRGLWVASGFGGHGLNTTAMGGELVARGIVETDQTWRLFAPYELVWAGGVLGRARGARHLLGQRGRSSGSSRACRAIASGCATRKAARLAARNGHAAPPDLPTPAEPRSAGPRAGPLRRRIRQRHCCSFSLPGCVKVASRYERHRSHVCSPSVLRVAALGGCANTGGAAVRRHAAAEDHRGDRFRRRRPKWTRSTAASAPRMDRNGTNYPILERKRRTLARVNDEIVATIVATLREARRRAYRSSRREDENLTTIHSLS